MPRVSRAWKIAGIAGAVVVLMAISMAVLRPRALGLEPAVEAFAAAGLGREVRISGDLHLDLLPYPSIVASDVRVADRGDGVSLTARRMRLQLALPPLLLGHMQPRRLQLTGAVLTLPWPLPPLSGVLDTGRDVSVEWSDGKAVLAGVAMDVPSASLKQSSASGAQLQARLRQTDGELDVKAHLATADAVMASAPLVVDLAQIEPTATGSENDVRTSTLGAVHFDGRLGASGIAGQIAAQGGQQDDLLGDGRWSAQARVRTDQGDLLAESLEVHTADDVLRGRAALHLEKGARLSAVLSTAHLNLDRAWRESPLWALSALDVFGLDLSVASAQGGGETFSDAHLVVTRDGDRLEIGDLTARWGGQSSLHGRGMFDLSDAQDWHGEGRIAFSAQDLRPASHLAARFLPGGWDVIAATPNARMGALEARFQLHPTAMELDDLSAHLGQSDFKGRIGLDWSDERPSLKADLRADTLTLDKDAAWVVAGLRSRVDLDARIAASRVETGFSVADQVDRHSEATPLEDMKADFALTDGQMTLRSLTGTLFGMAFSASSSMDAANHVEGRLDLAGDAAALGRRLPALIPSFLPWPTLVTGPLQIQSQWSGEMQALAVRSQIQLGDLHIDAQPVVDMMSGVWNGPVAVQHPGAVRLAGQMGLADAAHWVWGGSFSMIGGFAGQPGLISVSNLDLTAGNARATAQGSLDWSGTVPVVTGNLAVTNLIVPAFSTTQPLHVAGLRGWGGQIGVQVDQFSVAGVPFKGLRAMAGLENGILSVQDMTLTHDDGNWSGHVTIDASTDDPHLDLQGKASALSWRDLAPAGIADFDGKTLSGEMDVHTMGRTVQAWRAGMSGQAHLTLDDAVLKGIDLGAVGAVVRGARPVGKRGIPDALRTAAQGGHTSFSTADLHLGLSQGRADLTGSTAHGDAGECAMAGFVDLAQRSVDVQLRLTPTLPSTAKGSPSLGVALTGSWNAPHHALDIIDLVNYMAPPKPVEPPAPPANAATDESSKKPAPANPVPPKPGLAPEGPIKLAPPATVTGGTPAAPPAPPTDAKPAGDAHKNEGGTHHTP